MMTHTAFWGQNQSSYKMAAFVMEKQGLPISCELIRQVSGFIGNRVFTKNCEEAKEMEEHQANLKPTHQKPGVLYILMDGAMINTRKKDKNGSSFRENKLGMVFNSNDLRVRADTVTNDIKEKTYVSYLGNVDEFKKHLYECAVQNGYGQFEKTVIISDGAPWIRNGCQKLFADGLQILDFYHLAQHIYDFAKAIYPNDAQKQKAFADELIELAREGKTETLLSRLAEYKDTKLPGGASNLYTYIWNNREKMDYAWYREQGFYIGSGPIESANKTVLQKRCKQAGMRWEENNAQCILTLRAKVESNMGHYESFSDLLTA